MKIPVSETEEINMFDKTAFYYNAIKEYSKTHPFEICKAVLVLIERYCTSKVSKFWQEAKFLQKVPAAVHEYKNIKKLETLESVLDSYVEKKNMPNGYEILDMSKIPQGIQNNIISAANKKSKTEKKLEKQTKSL